MFDGNATSIIIALIALITLFGGSVVWVARYSLNRVSKDLVAHTAASFKQTTSNNKVAKAVDSFEKYLRERNGRDAEVHAKLMGSQAKMIDTLAKLPPTIEKIANTAASRAADTVIQQEVREQHVTSQEVDKLVVKK